MEQRSRVGRRELEPPELQVNPPAARTIVDPEVMTPTVEMKIMTPAVDPETTIPQEEQPRYYL